MQIYVRYLVDAFYLNWHHLFFFAESANNNNKLNHCTISSGVRRRILSTRHYIRKHSRTRKRASSSTTSKRRLIRSLQMRHPRLPRHTLRPFLPTILSRMRYLWHSRLHIRQRRSRLPRLQYRLSNAAPWTVHGHHCPVPSHARWKHWDCDPELLCFGYRGIVWK